MEKLQLMMFEAIGYKLKFSQKVTERYLDVLGVRFGKNSEMEQLMKTFISDRSTQEEIISNSRHKAYNEFRLLAKMQLKYDIEKNNKHDITHFPPFPAWCGHTLLDVPRQFVERHKRHAFQPHGMELDGSFLVIRDTAAESHIPTGHDRCKH